MDKYKSIRPYMDNEVSEVLTELLNDSDLIETLLGLRFPKLANIFPGATQVFAKKWLKSKVKHIDTVEKFQDALLPHAEQLIESTTDELTISGLENIKKDEGYLFISNHRDIAMDSALLSYLLKLNHRTAPRNAIGSNLMDREFVGKLLRLNKSFIVKRGITKPRELLVSLLQLSGYIRHSVKKDQHSVWLAQREGRAKDGLDKTDNAIIKMLMMSAKKNMEFEPALHELNIVPVSVSYEYDPCDALKAKELSQLASTGDYIKAEDEDAQSIFTGIKGYKGRVHISLGQALNGMDGLSESKQVTSALDCEIVGNYILFPSNYFAYQILEGVQISGPCLASGVNFSSAAFAKEEKVFLKRVESYPQEHRQYLLEAYANPIKHKIQLGMM